MLTILQFFLTVFAIYGALRFPERLFRFARERQESLSGQVAPPESLTGLDWACNEAFHALH